MGRVRFAPRALEQLDDIWQYIAADNEAAADKIYDQIRDHVITASDNPGIGVVRIASLPNVRSLIVGSYLVFYETEPGGIIVLAIVHGMREPKTWLD